MNKEIITFSGIETKERKFYNYGNWNCLWMDKLCMDIGNILISNKISFVKENTLLITWIMIIIFNQSI